MTQAIELIAWHANGSKQSCTLTTDQGVFVGKSSNCGFQLDGADISDIHCRIGLESGRLWIQDWMSARGTKVDGEEVSGKTQVGHGAVVEVGPYKIQISKSGASATTTPTKTVDLGERNQPEKRSEDEQSAPSPATDTEAKMNELDELPAECEDYPDEALEPDTTETDGIQIDLDDTDIFGHDDLEEEIVDLETVQLLQAEIEDLRSALTQRDADRPNVIATHPTEAPAVDTERVSQRMQELIEEANRADERVMLLEEMLLAADDTNRFEVEERGHLEAWVKDIETRIGQREQEHSAELDALRKRLDDADRKYTQLQRKLQKNSNVDDDAHKELQRSLELLQSEKRGLEDHLDEERKLRRRLETKVENQAQQNEIELREERAKIAKEQADVSRLKFQLADKLKEVELPRSLPKSECDPRLQTLNEHRQTIREMSQQRKQQATLSERLKHLWGRVEQ